MATVTAFYFRKENVILRLPFTLCLQNAADFLQKAKWEGEVISEAYHLDRLLVIFIGLVLAIGLFTPLGNLKKFYTWLIEQVILMIAFLAVFSYWPSDLKEEISAQVFIAVSVTIALCKWAAILSAKQTVAMFIVVLILVHIVTSLFVGVTLVLRNICLAYLIFASVIHLYKACPGVLQLVQDFPGFMIHTGRIIRTYGWLDCFIFHWERIGLDEVWMGRWLIKFLGKFIFSLEHGVLSGICGSFVECSDIRQDLLGASIVVGVAVNVAFDIINRILKRNVERTMEERHRVAWTERISFFSWTLMVGLTIDPKSGYRMGIEVIMYGTISSFISSRLWHELTKPALVDLGANYTGVFNTKHLRTLAVCAVILILLGYLVLVSCQLLPFDPFLFGVISWNLVTIVQVTRSLFTYALLILNFHFNVRDLDKYIYYINAGSNVLEFLVDGFDIGYLVWIIINTDWNIAVAMPSSWFAYSVIKRALYSKNKFLLKRRVLKTLDFLEWATEEQLEQLNDVCCICFEELDSAKVTKCNHYFHRFCLSRCLHKQDKCPLCHADILPQN